MPKRLSFPLRERSYVIAVIAGVIAADLAIAATIYLSGW
jgi:hypothetical protein